MYHCYSTFNDYLNRQSKLSTFLLIETTVEYCSRSKPECIWAQTGDCHKFKGAAYSTRYLAFNTFYISKFHSAAVLLQNINVFFVYNITGTRNPFLFKISR